ncbi:MAG: FKBP-type peptidyl-prolyl cis-trans isomerase [Bacteroidales bacterium]|nr:FKBP-type peptidyl-prolyl cis-trans isomerase [Bacteroidales bacterium]
MKIKNGTLVTLEYDLFVESFDGELIESVKSEEPAVFLCGNEEMLETFEEKLMGLETGDSFKFSLTKNEAYGDEDEEAYAEFPKNVFLDEEDSVLPEIGDYVPMEDEDGTVFDGIVDDITDDFIIIDFNHPLAGEDLFFTGKILKVEDTPPE